MNLPFTIMSPKGGLNLKKEERKKRSNRHRRRNITIFENMFSFRDIFRMWLIDKKKNREGEAKEVKTSSIQEKPNNFEFRNWIS